MHELVNERIRDEVIGTRRNVDGCLVALVRA